MNEQKTTCWTSTKDFCYTLFVFVGFLLALPALVVCYLYVQTYRWFTYRVLVWQYPHLEIVKYLTTRAAMDTYRTQGVLSVLLQIKGQCDPNLVRQKIMKDVIEKRRKDGTLRFPHMKNCLTSCWGRYAWIRNISTFDIHNHVIHVTNPLFRNKVVTSANIQEYISYTIAKFIPPWNNTPPWQIMIITTEPDRFYILARVHHLYLSEDNISFGHLLMIYPEDQWVQTSPQDIDSIENILQQIFRTPRAVPLLYDLICDIMSNKWNELLYAYDPTLNPYFQKQSPNIFQFYIVCVITAFVIVQKYFKTRKNLMHIIRVETRKRHINLFQYLRCLINTLYPFVILKIIISSFWWFTIKCILHFPITILHIMYETPMYLTWFFTILRAIGELIYISHLIYTAPRVLLDELFWPMFRRPKHHFQNISLSGRKVVCWTEPIPIDLIRKIRDRTGVASCEIQLYGVAAGLNEYFQKYNKFIETDEILSTVRFVPQEHLLKSANRISSGLLCLALPVNMPEDDALYGLHLMQLSLQEAMTSQTALYLASLWQYDYGLMSKIFPSFIIRIVLYVLSTRYSIMLTQVEAHTKEMKRRHLVWGQEVESILYWRPPQANVSLSVTLISYGEELRFAVMADDELSPEYTIIVSQYISYIKQLAEEAENYSTSVNSGIQSPLTPII